MGIYQRNGYVDIRKILSYGMTYNAIVGGRGTGKTFTSLETVIEDGKKFIYMRRTQSQCDMINKPEFSPFKSLNILLGWNIGTATISKYNSGFYRMEETDDGKIVPSGPALGYTCALSTVSNIRGFDTSDVEIIIYDEFIPERHERLIKDEAAAFFNAYETINRNRELSGRDPVKVLLMSNANDMANPLFLEMRLVRRAEILRRKGQEIDIDHKRGVGLFLLNGSPISELKAETALYKLTAGTEFAAMSIENDFADDNGEYKSMPIGELRPIVAIGEICIYAHKSKPLYYVSTHIVGSPPRYSTSDTDRKRFFRAYNWIWSEYMSNRIIFEEYLCEALLTKAFA